jgi:hypothetical protein
LRKSTCRYFYFNHGHFGRALYCFLLKGRGELNNPVEKWNTD